MSQETRDYCTSPDCDCESVGGLKVCKHHDLRPAKGEDRPPEKTDTTDVRTAHDAAMRQTYLGDGLYARFDGFQVWLETSGGSGAQTVALEPAVIAAFTRYVQKIRDDYGVPDWGK